MLKDPMMLQLPPDVPTSSRIDIAGIYVGQWRGRIIPVCFSQFSPHRRQSSSHLPSVQSSPPSVQLPPAVSPVLTGRKSGPHRPKVRSSQAESSVVTYRQCSSPLPPADSGPRPHTSRQLRQSGPHMPPAQSSPAASPSSPDRCTMHPPSAGPPVDWLRRSVGNGSACPCRRTLRRPDRPTGHPSNQCSLRGQAQMSVGFASCSLDPGHALS